MTHTQFEIEFINRVREFTARTGITAPTICRSFNYFNSIKISQFMNGKGYISSKTMGKMIAFMEGDNINGKMELLTKEQILKIATSHQRQMCSTHPHAIIGTIEDAINEILLLVSVSGSFPNDDDIEKAAERYDNSMSSMAESVWMPEGFKKGAKWMRKIINERYA